MANTLSTFGFLALATFCPVLLLEYVFQIRKLFQKKRALKKALKDTEEEFIETYRCKSREVEK